MPVKNSIPGQQVTKEKQERARELRHDMTPAEIILWNELRANELGVRFRRHTAPRAVPGAGYTGIHRRFLLSSHKDHTGSSTRRGWLWKLMGK